MDLKTRKVYRMNLYSISLTLKKMFNQRFAIRKEM